MDRSGAETMLMNIFRKVDKTQFHFMFLLCDSQTGAYDREIESLGGTIYYIDSLGSINYVNYIEKIKRVIAQIPKVDVVHIHMDWQCGFIAYAIHCAGIKNIVVHNHSSSFDTKGGVKKIIAVWISKLLIRRYAKMKS